jgi:acyl-CoA thioester hydrolase
MVSLCERVRFYETDLMAVVHHANYLRWFEMGRVAYLRHAGIDLNEMMEAGFMVPIVDVHCRYHQSARFDDEILIQTTLESCSKVKIVFRYQVIRKADGVLLAEGSSTNAFTTKEGKVTRLNDFYYGRLQNMLKEERETKGC